MAGLFNKVYIIDKGEQKPFPMTFISVLSLAWLSVNPPKTKFETIVTMVTDGINIQGTINVSNFMWSNVLLLRI